MHWGAVSTSSLLITGQPQIVGSRIRLCCRASSSGGKAHRRKARRPGSVSPSHQGISDDVHGWGPFLCCTGQFEVKVLSPPPRTLGIHNFPADTHNGDQIEVEGQVPPV